jgi:hypothetical protein
MGRGLQAWEKAGRARMRSPGRPPVGRVDHRRWFWEAIARGVPSDAAGIEAGVSAAVGVRWFREGGGMPTVSLDAPSARYLCFAEREDIAILRAEGKGVREIAREVGRSPSTISRELRRNAATRAGKLEYRASVAQWHAEQRAKRPKAAKLASNARLREYVQERLAGEVQRPDGARVPGRGSRGTAGATGVARTVAGAGRGVRSRSRGDWRSTTRMMSRCGSRMKRSTSRCTCRAAERWPAS